ncbi:siderophore-interacting protein [Demetria terragena]|uniref:siderophore-interacting protein n=1 Tax=Demetria terragena TaxID=63959 RepID=UPI00035CE945|nr:SIP domain-containing protein [Demetria terragena]
MPWNDFVLSLTETSRVAKNLRRLEFEVVPDSGHGYDPIDPGDEAIAFYFSADEHPLDTRPAAEESSGIAWELTEPERCTGSRNFTIRQYDPITRRMLIDVAEHDHGPAIDWFRAAQPGWRTLAAGPRSWHSPPADASRHILAGDLASLPAIARIMENTDPDIHVTVVAEVLDDSEIDYLPRRDRAEIVPLLGSGNGVTRSRLAAALGEVDLPADAYLWLAGEAADTRAGKKHVRSLGWPRNRANVVGYWRFNSEEWEKKFAERGSDQLIAVYQDAVKSGMSEEDAAEVYDAALEKAGL